MGRLSGRLPFGGRVQSSCWPLLLAAAFAFSFLVSPFGAGSRAQGWAEGNITYFYEKPDLEGIPGFLSLIDTTGAVTAGKADNRPPIIGFLAALFQQNPDRVKSWISGQYSRHLQGVIAVALARAGMAGRSATYLRDNGWPAEVIDRATQIPSDLPMTRIRSADDLDILWGASFATGDRRYPEKIIDFVGIALDKGTFTAEQISAFAPPPTDMRNLEGNPELIALLHRITPNDRLRLILCGVSVWALGSNAVQHEFVMELIQERLAQAPSSDLSYLLRKSVFRQSYSKFTVVEGNDVWAMFSQSSEPGVGKRAGDVLLGNLEKPKAAISEVEPLAQNEFKMSEPVHLWGVLMKPRGERLGLTFEVSLPSGSRFTLDPPREKAREPAAESEKKYELQAVNIAIDPARLREEGVYTINGTVTAEGHGELKVANHFFVGSRQ